MFLRICLIIIMCSCKDEDEQSLQSFFTIENEFLNHHVTASTQHLSIPINTDLSKDK